MRKVGVVASAEFSAAVRSKAFLIGLVLLPVLMVGGASVQLLAERHMEGGTRRFAIVDRTGVLAQAVAERARSRRTLPQMEPEIVPPPAAGRSLEDLELELSDRVRKGDLFAFVEIPADALGDAPFVSLAYHSDHPTAAELPQFLEATINDEIRLRRFQEAGVNRELVARLDRHLPCEEMGLLARASDGKPIAAERVDKIRSFVVPMVFMFLLFIVVMTGAPQLLNSVLEEKMSRISEVLLGSVTPFELMLGKLVGAAGVSLLLSSLYLGGGFATAAYLGKAGAIPLGLLPWFLLFLELSAFLFGSIFIAIGSACSDMKDTQNLMLPVVALIMIPVFTWQAVLQAPASGFAVVVSLFPPATPFLMMLRIALRPGPAVWQVALGVTLAVATTVGAVWAAGKIFRTGVLMQGKGASLAQMIRWVAKR